MFLKGLGHFFEISFIRFTRKKKAVVQKGTKRIKYRKKKIENFPQIDIMKISFGCRKEMERDMTEKELQRLKEIDEVIASGKYQDTWESLQQYEQPRWFRDAKFGVFIHWGPYSVPAFANEWYSRNMYIQGTPEFEHHVKTYGPHKDFGYKDFIPMFRAEKFQPEEWIRLFKKAGARYVVPVAEHHDGFQMYKSEISHWNAFEMGPKRDVLGELS